MAISSTAAEGNSNSLDPEQSAISNLYDQDTDSMPSDATSWHRFFELGGSLFPDNDGDYASSFLGGEGNYTAEMYPEKNCPPTPADPHPRDDPEHAWRYDGDYVWTGEAMAYAPRLGGDVGSDSHSGGPPALAGRPVYPTTDAPSPLSGSTDTETPVPSSSATFQIHQATHSDSVSIRANAFLKSPTNGFYTTYHQPYSHPPATVDPRLLALNYTLLHSSTSCSSPPPSPKPPATTTQPPDLTATQLILLHKWRVVKKKGSDEYLIYFPGQTRQSLAEQWRVGKGRAKELVEREDWMKGKARVGQGDGDGDGMCGVEWS